MRIGFIGLGMVSTTFLKAMHQADSSVQLYGFDTLYDTNPQLFKSRLDGIDFNYVGKLEYLINNVDIVISTVTTNVAIDVGKQVAPLLVKDQVYIDLNSMSPNKKKELNSIISPICPFVEGVILGAIATTGAATKILLGGHKAEQVSGILNNLGLRTKAFSKEIGEASLFKMIRSVLTKGIEALLVELMLSSKSCGMEDIIWDDLCDFMSKKSFKQIAENWVSTHGNAATRRYYEMLQVSETLKDLGIDPIMAEATGKRLEKSANLKIEQHFSGKQGTYKEVIDFLAANGN